MRYAKNDREWSPEKPCGGISVNGAEPPWCETHMRPWGHRICICGPDSTGEDIDIRPDCHAHEYLSIDDGDWPPF